MGRRNFLVLLLSLFVVMLPVSASRADTLSAEMAGNAFGQLQGCDKAAISPEVSASYTTAAAPSTPQPVEPINGKVIVIDLFENNCNVAHCRN